MDYYMKTEESNRKKASVSSTIRIQETFLNHLRREKINVVIQLSGQTIVEGLIIGFDQESIVVAARGTQQLLYKSAIVSIKPFEELHLIFNDRKQKSLSSNMKYPRVASRSSIH